MNEPKMTRNHPWAIAHEGIAGIVAVEPTLDDPVDTIVVPFLDRISRTAPTWVQAAAVDILMWLRDHDDE